jgi:excinuclease UvrABC nuclease subunit
MIRSIEELNQSSIELQGACSGVYFLFHNNELVYIGQGWNCFLRVAEHTRKESEKIFDRWSYIRIDAETERKSVECELVKTHKTKYNRIYA